MSKRLTQTAVGDYIAQGFIREALVNYLALLGWSTGTEEEILSLEELAVRFDVAHIQKGGAVFDRERLEWLNGQWIRRLSPDDLVDRLRPFLAAEADAGNITRMPSDDEIAALIPLVQERLPTLGVIVDLVGFLFVDMPVLDIATLVPKRWDAETTLVGLSAARETIEANGELAFDHEGLELALRGLADARGWKAGDLFMAIRVAVTGRTATPPLFETLVALGFGRTIERLNHAHSILSAVGAGTPR
jgi:glutamyl-tRNA synthetase